MTRFGLLLRQVFQKNTGSDHIRFIRFCNQSFSHHKRHVHKSQYSNERHLALPAEGGPSRPADPARPGGAEGGAPEQVPGGGGPTPRHDATFRPGRAAKCGATLRPWGRRRRGLRRDPRRISMRLISAK